MVKHPGFAVDQLGVRSGLRLELIVERRGEITDVFLANTPTLRYLPPTYYWLGRAHEGVNSTAEAKKNFEEFLKRRPAPDAADDLAADARRRLQ